MAVLTDRLDFVIGKKAAGPLEEHFGIRTVNDLLRHYPRKYSDGMTVRGEGEEPSKKASTSPSSTSSRKAEAAVDEPRSLSVSTWSSRSDTGRRR